MHFAKLAQMDLWQLSRAKVTLPLIRLKAAIRKIAVRQIFAGSPGTQGTAVNFDGIQVFVVRSTSSKMSVRNPAAPAGYACVWWTKRNLRMQSLLYSLSIMASLGLIVRLILARPLISGLTLIWSWNWAIVGSLTLLCAIVIGGTIGDVSAGWRTAAQYLAVIMLLTPLVSTLGARRPGVGAWQWFVVVPLILVLQWPATSQLLSSRGREALDLGVPATAGILLVLLMSAGTGIGTSVTVPAVLYLSGVILSLLPSTGWVDPMSTLPLWTPILMLLGEMIAERIILQRYRSMQSGSTASEVADQTWALFQDLYGLIWARRVLERVNQFSNREQWTVSLTMDGFRRADGSSAEDEELRKPLEAFRWVLGRFADESWLTRALGRFS